MTFKIPDIRDIKKFTQDDIDNLAHFIQVVSEIQKTTWYEFPIKVVKKGDFSTGECPNLENSSYAILLIRQLTISDDLFNKAYKSLNKNCQPSNLLLELSQDHKNINKFLKSDVGFPSLVISNKPVTNFELFNSMIYGSGVFHSLAKKGGKYFKNRELFEAINLEYKNKKASYLFCFHSMLKQIVCYCSGTAFFAHACLSSWQNQHKELPLPNVFWLDQCFNSKSFT